MPSFPDGADLNTLRDRITAALDEQGHNTAASLLAAGLWKLDQDGAIQVEVAVKKIMLGLTMNGEAWKIVREALREAGGTEKMTVVPGGASSQPASADPPASRDGKFGSIPLDQTISAQVVSPKSTIKVFISHSSRDEQLAASLIELLRSAMPDLRPASIRCTSVPGYKLEGGVLTGPHLREELLQAGVFIGLLTKDSLESSYVLFELGARWGANTGLKPLVAAGLEVSAVKSPLGEHHVQSCDVETDLHQLLDEIADRLVLTLLRPHFYDRQLKRLVELSTARAKARMADSSPSTVTGSPVIKKPRILPTPPHDVNLDVSMETRVIRIMKDPGRVKGLIVPFYYDPKSIGGARITVRANLVFSNAENSLRTVIASACWIEEPLDEVTLNPGDQKSVLLYYFRGDSPKKKRVACESKLNNTGNHGEIKEVLVPDVQSQVDITLLWDQDQQSVTYEFKLP